MWLLLISKYFRSGRIMKKWVGLLKSIVFSFVVYMWFLGSSLLVQIDSQHMKEASKDAGFFNRQSELENGLFRLTENINNYCAKQGERVQENFTAAVEVAANQVQSLSFVDQKGKDEKEAKEAFKQARREKTIRDNVIYIPDLRQLWCLVPKAASTSWSHKILDSVSNIPAGLREDLRNESIPVQVLLRKHYGSIGTKKYKELIESKNVQRILLVRNPLSRIVSAFEDKLKNRKARLDSMYFYGHYGVKINRAFRKNRRINKRKEPTFEEFIDYLLETDPEDYDEHWKPISLLCGPCRVKYNHIIKQEDLENGLIEHHLVKLGFKSPQVSNNNLRRDNMSVKEFKKVIDYFANITNEKKLLLTRKFEDDFRFFGYDSNELL